ncbi:guanosine-5'-triphosphate,3'-diphosphate pyrophosphatase [Neptunicella marina]|uniref:Guanosine-5'-triphosphate,3'-diphosphate pyrophosphatase n=1 Tax=Neptunicella marina TaxID=2125989 RepID=A0A8J6LZD2_9ALTE|nr:guanosine-5'-triphosphate,3'-diphosphate pyrophosphatase [Neptunicella marina]MBC3766569.1 guanosine-5'-triphosphate,3'-diphosphate pyrophosphatase [Neptunicella marina]
MSNGLANNALSQEHLYAAIDLGSNSFHMVIVKVAAGSVQIIGKVKQKIRLAAGLDENSNLDMASMQRGWDCLHAFAERIQDIPKENLRVVATATLRLAKNADVFLQKGQQILSHPIEVISGEEEAHQIYLGVAYTSANQGQTLVIDIGGASTEIIVGEDFEPLQLTSLNMGCVTYLEKFFSDGMLSAANFEQAISAAKEQVSQIAEMFIPYNWLQCMGASGTPQAIVEILVTQGVNDSIRLEYLHNLRQQCIDCVKHADLDIQGLEDSRKQPFPSGLAILIALFEELNIEEMHISGGALREGLIYGMLEDMREDNIRQQAIFQLAQRFHIDTAQALRVTATAAGFYNQLPAKCWSANFDAEGILQAAAMLHEIGLHIEYKSHHLHAAYLLSFIDLQGYSKLQRDCIRAVVTNFRQQIDVGAFAGFHVHIRRNIILLTRILRIAVILCIRRNDNAQPSMLIAINDDHLYLQFPPGWLKAHPLIDAELANERWLQHKAGWEFSCE